ncbi:MAG: NADH-quinone oxidoreductase subunit C [Candidatus Parvarchaeota archaeon]|nr:NADH-quinone oxidoreductase subunit C [Candidatus Parvarchaeota archaeon]MCL5101626.1 NADH-quinone oxidoreductase subunit C [Candidatus Parvarchaeota archaeon]
METVERLKSEFSSSLTSLPSTNANETLLLLSENEALKKLVKSISTEFDILFTLLVVDRPPEAFELNYVFSRYRDSALLTIRVNLNHDKPVIDSIAKILPSAEWEEREAYDLFGIKFRGHPDLRRILLQDDWPGRPLRKDFVVTDEIRNWTGLDLKF